MSTQTNTSFSQTNANWKRVPVASTNALNVRNRLKISVVEASGLAEKEIGEQAKAFGDTLHFLSSKNDFFSNDPFCKISVGARSFKTTAKHNTVSPKWNESFFFENVDPSDELKIVIRDALTIGQGHFFGEISIPIQSLTKNAEIEQWYTILPSKSTTHKVSGKLLLKLVYLESATDLKEEVPPTASDLVKSLDLKIETATTVQKIQQNQLQSSKDDEQQSNNTTDLNLNGNGIQQQEHHDDSNGVSKNSTTTTAAERNELKSSLEPPVFPPSSPTKQTSATNLTNNDSKQKNGLDSVKSGIETLKNANTNSTVTTTTTTLTSTAPVDVKATPSPNSITNTPNSIDSSSPPSSSGLPSSPISSSPPPNNTSLFGSLLKSTSTNTNEHKSENTSNNNSNSNANTIPTQSKPISIVNSNRTSTTIESSSSPPTISPPTFGSLPSSMSSPAKIRASTTPTLPTNLSTTPNPTPSTTSINTNTNTSTNTSTTNDVTRTISPLSTSTTIVAPPPFQTGGSMDSLNPTGRSKSPDPVGVDQKPRSFSNDSLEKLAREGISTTTTATTPSTPNAKRQSSTLSSDKKQESLAIAKQQAETKAKSDAYVQKFGLPLDEVLETDYSCALLSGILWLHGRLYISQKYMCFHSNIFGSKTTIVLAFKDIEEIKRGGPMNIAGLNLKASGKDYVLGAFFSREKTYEWLIKNWTIHKNVNQTTSTTSTNSASTSSNSNSLTSLLPTTLNPIEDADTDDDSFLPKQDESAEIDKFLSSTEDFPKGENAFLSSPHEKMIPLLENEEYDTSVMNFFKYFFADETFTKLYHQKRNDFEINITDWKSDPQHGTLRDVMYRARLNHAIGPSSARCVETQRYLLSRTSLSIQSVQVMYDIPFGDCFRVELKYAVDSTSNNSCKLNVWLGVFFTKSTWFKGKIEGNTISETKESVKMCASLIHSELNRIKLEKASGAVGGSTKHASTSVNSNEKSTISSPTQPDIPQLKSNNSILTPNVSVDTSGSLIERLMGFKVQFGVVLFAMFIMFVIGKLTVVSVESLLYVMLIGVGVLSMFVITLEGRLINSERSVLALQREAVELRKTIQQQQQQIIAAQQQIATIQQHSQSSSTLSPTPSENGSTSSKQTSPVPPPQTPNKKDK